MNKKFYEIPKYALLIIAGIVWMIAGFNVVRLGIISYKIIVIKWYLPVLSLITFLLFGTMFYKMTHFLYWIRMCIIFGWCHVCHFICKKKMIMEAMKYLILRFVILQNLDNMRKFFAFHEA